jgi:DNA-binding XRE family transcriptional regulator
MAKYDKKYCSQLIEHSKQGLSFASFAGVVGVSRQALYDWEKKHEEFAEAKKIGESYSLLSWEKVGLGLVTGKIHGSATAFIHQICNRFPDLYKQRVDVNAMHSGNISLDVTYEVVTEAQDH